MTSLDGTDRKLSATLTSDFLNSFGFTQRTKNGWQALNVLISSSRDFLNCDPSVCVLFFASDTCVRRQTTGVHKYG